MRHRALIAGLLLLTTLSAPVVQAQSENAFDNFEAGLGDAAYLGVVLPLNVGLALNPVAPNARQRPPGLDEATRRALVWDNRQLARDISDVLFFSMISSALVMPMVGEWDISERSLRGSLVGLEAMLATSLVTEIAKQLTGRERPNEYYATRDPEEPEYEHFEREEIETSNRSFFSGHASMAFSSATLLTVFAYEYDWLDRDVRWVIPAAAYTTAAVTGYLRIAGDKHWLTDVLVGALVGTGTTYLVFALRTQ